GIVEKGMVFNSLGTSGVVFAYSDTPAMDPKLRVHTFCHAVPGKWHVMGVMLSAGGSLRWFRDTFCGGEKAAADFEGEDAYNLISRAASTVPIGSEGLFFLPYLSGERCPWPDPDARGAFIGATLSHTRRHFARSVFEGIAFGLNDSFEILKEMNVPIETVIATGGGAKSGFFRSVLADVTGFDHCALVNDEGPGYGAAILAGTAAGIYGDVCEASKANAVIKERTKVCEENRKLYAPFVGEYKTLYPALKNTFQSIGRL
ncbi:MAG: xylulokinase, partial [Abditibacteriota bacterium]|nr:xylulokinase [Abditibacteriota bacterium]